MKITVLTLFPELFSSFLDSPVLHRAMERGIADVEIVDLKNYAGGSFRHLDDSPFGGGPGMIMRCQPIADALDAVRSENCRTVLLSPKGKPYTQTRARELAREEHLILLCGHYEGIDARAEKYFDEQISIGDYILTGGELAAQVIADSVVRLQSGALREGATVEESHENGLLEYPQYTRPADFRGDPVPEILLSGHDGKIAEWRTLQSLLLTKELRPDLFDAHRLTEREKTVLERYEREKKQENES